MPFVAPLTPEDLPAIEAFLSRTFNTPPGFRLFEAGALYWKAFSAHPWQLTARSYGIRDEKGIEAHGILVPLQFQTPSRTLTSHCVIDWASGPTMLGGGVLVYQKLAELADVQVGIGGSAAARKILPRMKYRVAEMLTLYRRVLKPAKLFLNSTPGEKNGRGLLRMGRDYGRLLSARPPAVPPAMTATRVSSFDDTTPLPDPEIASATVSVRSPVLLNHLLTCNLAAMEGYQIRYQGKPFGYCLLSRLENECRVADLWIASRDLDVWRQAVALAAQLAGPQASFLSAAASTSLEREAWTSCGFSFMGESPLYVLDPRKLLPPGQIRIGLIDNDSFYL